MLDVADHGATATLIVALLSSDIELAARVLDSGASQRSDKCRIDIAVADVIVRPRASEPNRRASGN